MQINENYVETSMYKKIVDHLQRHNTVIMKGKPGLITSILFVTVPSQDPAIQWLLLVVFSCISFTFTVLSDL